MLSSELDHMSVKIKEILVLLEKSPIQPGYFIILTVSVIVAKLCIAELIPSVDHWSSSAAHKNSYGISHHAISKFIYLRIVSFALDATVPTSVVVCSIRIVPAVVFVVLVVVGVKIIERKSVMTGKEIYR